MNKKTTQSPFSDFIGVKKFYCRKNGYINGSKKCKFNINILKVLKINLPYSRQNKVLASKVILYAFIKIFFILRLLQANLRYGKRFERHQGLLTRQLIC